MKLTEIEKAYVNSSWQVKRNFKIAEDLLTQIDLSNVKNVLEIGCGVGVLSSYLADKYSWSVTGIDIDSEQIEIARRDQAENEYLKFVEADATNLPYGDDDFDLVLSFDVLHHIPDWVGAIGEIYRVLKPDGFYVLNDLAFSSFLVKNFRGLLSKFGGLFTVDEFSHQLKVNNFDVVYEEKANNFLLTRDFSIVSQKSPNTSNTRA
ncbi:MAG: class I SAM-dependent methyltransferase [Candidatus Bathyarchaeota archaeon]|nr:class I SAM-dependent methyltransferase [Candidatus Bathyarchaeota archaeon]